MKSLALSQLAPGPLAAQLAICLGYVHSRVRGATLVALAFVLPSFVMTVAISWLYVRFGGLSWMQAAFWLFLLCGLAAMVVQAPPAWLKRSAPACFVVVATPEVLG